MHPVCRTLHDYMPDEACASVSATSIKPTLSGSLKGLPLNRCDRISAMSPRLTCK